VLEHFLVDTGSFYSAISPDVRDRLGLATGIPQQVMLADGRVIDTEVTLARLRCWSTTARTARRQASRAFALVSPTGQPPDRPIR
jgi:predicted aspartyl protease